MIDMLKIIRDKFSFVKNKITKLIIFKFVDGNASLINKLLENERERIYQDIHDGIGSKLNLILILLQSENVDRDLLQNNIRACLSELRFIINNRSAVLNTPLHELVTDLCCNYSLFFGYQGINFDFSVSKIGDKTYVSDVISNGLLKITQEILVNSLKHSKFNRNSKF